jgi:uncharacterized repeat protein (TIGR03803 family)
MSNTRRVISLRLTWTLCLLAGAIAAQAAGAQTESILYDFTGVGAGDTPYAGVIMDSAGNLYGITCSGGAHDLGTAFELSPETGGGWTVKVLHAFGGTSTDGGEALSGLTLDTAGNLYGATAYGGPENFGIVFQLRPNTNGSWSEKILHTFTNNGKDGLYPGSSLTFDSAGNLYGTTWEGGTQNGGTVFELSPHAGNYSEKILYSLPNPKKSDKFTSNPLTFDSAGNLYGVTSLGGPNNLGFVFKLTPSTSGPWTATQIYAFSETGSGPYSPLSGVVFDAAGNLYGTSELGGTFGNGTVYELLPATGGGWTEQVLLSFDSSCSTGCEPTSGVILDSAGNLYGAAQSGGPYNGGTVYELSPTGTTWTQTVLYNLGSGTDGKFPYATLWRDSSGNLYDTTRAGGTKSEGTVFEITP